MANQSSLTLHLRSDAPNKTIWIHSIYIYIYIPEKRGRKPGMSLNGDRSMEGMEGNVAEESAWRGCVGCVVWMVWKEGRNVEEEGGEDGGRLGKVGKSEKRYTAFIPNKPLPITWPAASIPTTFSHSSPSQTATTVCNPHLATLYTLYFTL